jgi:hypothetical protein
MTEINVKRLQCVSHATVLYAIYKHCNENPIYVFPEKEICDLNPNFYIHVSMSVFLYSQDRSTYFPAAE